MALPADVYRGLKRRWYAGRRRLVVARRAINRVFAMDVADDVRRELCGEMFHQVLLLCLVKKGKKNRGFIHDLYVALNEGLFFFRGTLKAVLTGVALIDFILWRQNWIVCLSWNS